MINVKRLKGFLDYSS